MTFGVISLLAGVAVLAWPGRTLIVVAVLFGIQLVVTGSSGSSPPSRPRI